MAGWYPLPFRSVLPPLPPPISEGANPATSFHFGGCNPRYLLCAWGCCAPPECEGTTPAIPTHEGTAPDTPTQEGATPAIPSHFLLFFFFTLGTGPRRSLRLHAVSIRSGRVLPPLSPPISLFFFFCSLAIGPCRPLRLQPSDSGVYEPQIRAHDAIPAIPSPFGRNT